MSAQSGTGFCRNRSKPPLNSLSNSAHQQVLIHRRSLIFGGSVENYAYFRCVTSHLFYEKLTDIIGFVGSTLSFVGGHQAAQIGFKAVLKHSNDFFVKFRILFTGAIGDSPYFEGQ